MKCIVTGGAGFIGSHLVDRLLDDGHEVIALDNFVIGRPENLAARAGSSRLKVVRADVTDLEQIKPYFHGIDWVFHLAALADIVPSIESPIPYHRANVDGTVNVLEAARHAGAKRFVYAASSSCYGIPDVYPTPESAEIRPMYPYALTRISVSSASCTGAKSTSFPRWRCACSTCTGRGIAPRAPTAPCSVSSWRRSSPASPSRWSATASRRAILPSSATSRTPSSPPRAPISRTVFNVGSDNTYSVNRLVELLGGDKVHIPKRPGEPDCTYADITEIKRVLNWTPKVKFEDGVATMLKSMDQYKDAPLWTVDKIADATKDWFKYLGDDGSPQRQALEQARRISLLRVDHFGPAI